MAETSTRESVHWLVNGRVQCVGFRWFVLQAARRLAVRGEVRNLPDGRVEVYATASPEALRTLLTEVRRGPAGARVDEVFVATTEARDDAVDFEIRG